MVGRSRLSPVLDEIARRAEAEDKAVTAALEELGSWLGIGAAVVVNILNPELVVLGGYFGILARYLLPRALREMRRHVADPRQTRCRVVAGQVGLRAAAVGGAEIVRRAILADPSLLAGTPA
jgi:predicted NBD/HSP70 family sugar kinase